MFILSIKRQHTVLYNTLGSEQTPILADSGLGFWTSGLADSEKKNECSPLHLKGQSSETDFFELHNYRF